MSENSSLKKVNFSQYALTFPTVRQSHHSIWNSNQQHCIIYCTIAAKSKSILILSRKETVADLTCLTGILVKGRNHLTKSAVNHKRYNAALKINYQT